MVSNCMSFSGTSLFQLTLFHPYCVCVTMVQSFALMNDIAYFFHSHNDGYLGCFQVFAGKHCAALNTLVYVSL